MLTIKEQRYRRNYLSFSQGKDFVTSLPGNGARKMLFLSLYQGLKYSVKASKIEIMVNTGIYLTLVWEF